jgi:multidrug transporter EmrE-like cation transporter
MHKTTELILLAIVMSLLEAYCLYGAKKFEQDSHTLWYLSAVLGYAVIVLIIARMSRSGKIGIINSVWNGISICTSLALGLLMFKEMPSRMEMIGVVTIITGVILTQI